jgi:hypothetical protein
MRLKQQVQDAVAGFQNPIKDLLSATGDWQQINN